MAEAHTLHELCVEEAGRRPLLLLFLFFCLLTSAIILRSSTILISLYLAHLFPLQIVPLIPQPLPPLNILKQIVPGLRQDRGVVRVGI